MLRAVLKSALGGAGSQIVSLAAIPILARWYLPEDFAIWALCLAGIMILGSIATLRYELALVIPIDHQEAINLFWGAVICVVCAVIFAVFLLSPTPCRSILGLDKHLSFISASVMFASGVFSQGIMALMSSWAVRYQRYGLNSVAIICTACATTAIQLIFPWVTQASFKGLVYGIIVGQLIGVIVIIYGLAQRRQLPSMPTSWTHIWEIMRCHYRFPLYSVPMTLGGTARERATVVIIEQYIDKVALGSYAMVQRLVNFPVSLVSGAIRPVLFSMASKCGIEAMEERVHAILRILLVLSAPWAAFVMVFADSLLPLLLGEGWRAASPFLQILLWPAYTFLFCNWMDRLLDIGGKQRIGLILELVFAAFSLSVLGIILLITQSLIAAVVGQAIILVAYNLTYMTVVFRLGGYSPWPLFRMLPIAAMCYAFVNLVSLFFLTYLPSLVSMGCACAVVLFIHLGSWSFISRELIRVRA